MIVGAVLVPARVDYQAVRLITKQNGQGGASAPTNERVCVSLEWVLLSGARQASSRPR